MLTLKDGLIASSLNILDQFVRRMIGIVSLIILARVLTPADFGLVAIALIFFNFVEVVTNIGGRAYILSREKIDDAIVQSNWSLQFVIKNTVAIILAIFSVYIANFYDDPRLTPIILVFSLQIFIGTCGSPGLIYKDKKQDLKRITQWRIISRFVITGVTIFIAVSYKTYWALVIGQFLGSLSSVIASYAIAPLKPCFTFKNTRKQWEFSRWIMPQSLVNFFRSQIDAIYVSQIFDKETMGAYNSMRYYANIPATIFIKPIISTTLTQFSEFKNNKNYLSKQLQVTFYCLFFLAAPIIYLMTKNDLIVVRILLGEKWVSYASLLGIFSGLILLSLLNSILSQIVMLKDATRLLLVYSIFCVAAQVCLFTLVDFQDVYKLAEYKIGVDMILAVAFYIYVLWRLLSFNSLCSITSPSLITILCVVIAGYINDYVTNLENEFLDFFIKCITFSIFYILIQSAFIYCLRNKVHSFNYIIEKSKPIVSRLYWKR